MVPKPGPLWARHEQFSNAILSKPADTVTLEQHAEVVDECDAMIKSTGSARFVPIE